RDTLAPGRAGTERHSHCKQGHELNGANLYVNPKGRRFCRRCKADYALSYRQRENHLDALTAARARSEASALFAMIGRNGETLDSVRELTLVDPQSLKALRGFLAVQPKESPWVMEALHFRAVVLEKFNVLAGRADDAGVAV